MSFFLASPEEFLLGEEAGYCDHQKGEDQASYNAPERRADAYCVKPGGDSAQCQDRTCEETGDGICKHRVLTASAQTTSLYLPFELKCEDEGSGKGCHACGSKHIRKVAVVFCYTAVKRIEDDAGQQQGESNPPDSGAEISFLPGKCCEGYAECCCDDAVSQNVACE